jgi:hypothetical protein
VAVNCPTNSICTGVVQLFVYSSGLRHQFSHLYGLEVKLLRIFFAARKAVLAHEFTCCSAGDFLQSRYKRTNPLPGGRSSARSTRREAADDGVLGEGRASVPPLVGPFARVLGPDARGCSAAPARVDPLFNGASRAGRRATLMEIGRASRPLALLGRMVPRQRRAKFDSLQPVGDRCPGALSIPSTSMLAAACARAGASSI